MTTFTLDAHIEIPRGSRNKYEYDKETGQMRLDRTLYPAMSYPADYGYFPETLALDDDPLDCLVLLTEPTFPGCYLKVRPIGMLNMWDDKGQDEKILTVAVDDPHWNHINSYTQISPHLITVIENFFATYKDLEGKEAGVEGWKDAKEAVKIIKECQDRYK